VSTTTQPKPKENIMGKAMQAVCDHYGVDNANELFTEDDFNNDVMDSVQPSFCAKCGTEGDSIEPDGKNDCVDDECSGSSYSIQRIVLGM